jgi:hypothetical protein
MRFTKFPGASGRVVDAKTTAPISNAEVTLSLTQPAKEETKTVVTDSNGVFTIAPKKQWGIYIIPMDFMAYLGHISVSAEGYSNILKDLHSSPVGPEKTFYGDIALESKQ